MDALGVYLNDHLVGAHAAASLVRRGARNDEDRPLGHFLLQLAEALDADRGALEQIMELLQIRSRRIRQSVGWLGEKVVFVALGGGIRSNVDLSRLEELELLAVAIEAKRALWQSLRQLAVAHPNLRGVDFDHLIRRADEQREQLESWRLSAALDAFPASREREPEPLTSES